MDWSRLLLMFFAAHPPTITNSARLQAHGGRLLGATRAERFTHPYMVLIQSTINVTYSDGTIEQEIMSCSGSILSPKLVLTAAHCFHSDYNDYKPEKLIAVEVQAGTKDTYNDPITFQTRAARSIVASHLFNHSLLDPAKAGLDVAIVILDASLEYNEEVNQINIFKYNPHTLWSPRDEVPADLYIPMETHEDCLVLGFGENGQLTSGITTLHTDDECRAAFCALADDRDFGCHKSFWMSAEICTIGKDVSMCTGDGGGPLVCNHEIWGVLSYTALKNTKCFQGAPNLYASVDAIHYTEKLLFENEELRLLARHPRYKAFQNTTVRAHPFVVEVRVYTGDNQEWGQFTGTIISSNLILTACHAVKQDDGFVVDAPEVEVIAGAEPYIQTTKVRNIVTHPSCERKLLQTGKKGRYVYENDVAFLVLETSLYFGELVNSIELGEAKLEKALIKKNVECHVYGYGMKKPFRYNEPPMNTLSIGTVWLTGERKCQQRFCKVTRPGDELCTMKNYFSSGKLCGTRDDTVNCFGHTGGPVVCHGYVFGIDSYMLSCKERKCKAGTVIPLGETDECTDRPSLFMNSIAIWQLYGIIKNDPTLLAE